MSAVVAALVLGGCAPTPATLTARRVVGGLEVVADRPIDRVTVRGPDGVLAEVHRAPATTLFVPLVPPRGAVLQVAAAGATARVAVPALPADLVLEVPRGAPGVLVDDGAVVTGVGDPAAPAALRVLSLGAGTVTVNGTEIRLGPVGTATVVPLPPDAHDLHVAGGGDVALLSWRVDEAPPVSIAALRFPVAPDGAYDPSRASDAVVLPAWGTHRSAAGPYGHLGVTLENPASAARAVVVRALIDDPAFAPRQPGTTQPWVAAVAELPAQGRATLVLPVFVDPAAARPGPVSVAVEVSEVTGAAVLARAEATWTVTTAGAAGVAFLATLPLSLAGLVLLAVGGRRFLARSEVRVLTLVASFGAVTFVVGGAFQLLGYGVAAVLGPFAPFLTAWFDDLFRVVLLAALVSRVPRPGVVSAAATVGFLMRGLALGSFHPTDLLYLGNQVVLAEGFLWLSGLTRGAAWKSGPRWVRTLRTAVAFAPANAVGMVLGLVASQALYRMYWDPTWVLWLVLGPGFLYVCVAAALAAPLAAELEEVAE